MKTLLLNALFLSISLHAITLDGVIEKALKKQPSLEVIQARLTANKQSIEVANQFKNPQLALTSNTIDSSQAMSQTVVTLQQEIQYYNKRDTKQAVALAQEDILQEELNAAKVALVGKIKQEAYTLWELREQKRIIDDYIALTQKNIELFEAYTTVSSNQHMGIMKAELSLAQLSIKIATLDAQIYGAYSRLSYLAATKINELDITLEMGEKPEFARLKTTLTHNPSIELKAKEIRKQEADVALKDINKYPDFNLIAGYAYRENFDNYFNFGVALTLPIYGTEDALKEEAKALKIAMLSQKSDLDISVASELKVYYAQMLSAYQTYHIIQDDALPQVAHMFDLSSSSIATGGDLFKYIDVLFERLKLEQQSITAVALYNKNRAKISELAGEKQ